MASKTIVQRIALEGGDAIKDQLKALGDAGEKAFNQIQAAALKANFGQFSASLKTLGGDIATVGRRLALLGAGLTAAAAGASAGLLELAKSGAEAADQAGKAAEKTGLQVDAYGRLSFAAKQADVDNDQFVAGMSRLNKAIAEAAAEGTKAAGTLADAQSTIAQGAGFTTETFSDLGVTVTRFGGAVKKAAGQVKQSGSVFKDLGIKVKDSQGNLRATEDIIGDLAEAFSKMPDGPRKSALAIELFGKAGVQLIPFLNQGREGIKELGKEAERLGIVFTKSQADVGDALGDTLDEVSAATKGIRDQLGLIFAPGVTALAAGLRDAIVENKDAILAFGRALNAKLLSGIRDLLFALIGADNRVRNPWILIWRDAIVGFGRDVFAVLNNVVLPLFKAVRDAAGLVADALNKVFGTKITGGQLLIGAALLQLLGVFRVIGSAATTLIATFRLFGSVLAFVFSRGLIGSASAFFGALVTGATEFIGLIAGLVGWPALIIAGLVVAAAAVIVFWDQIKAAAQQAWDFLVSGAQQAWATISTLFTWDNIIAAAQAAGAAFVDLWVLQFQLVGQAFQAMAALFTWDNVIAAATLAGEQFVSLWQLQIDLVRSLFTSLVEEAPGLFVDLWSAQIDIVNSVFSSVSEIVLAILSGMASRAAPLVASLLPAWENLKVRIGAIWDVIASYAGSAISRIGSFIDSLITRISNAISRLKQLAGLGGDSSSSSSGGSGFASGGHVTGKGGPRSDSILAWLSNGEFVIQAAAVKKLGVGFLSAINQGVVPSLKSLRGFKIGGFVNSINRSMAIPRFAGGGHALADLAPSGMASMGSFGTLKLDFGLTPDAVFDMITDNFTATRLQQFAQKQATASAGRRPG
ncbi:phage tail tape measure protein [Mesorhizobium sp. M8A.F.Ca.ET.208.01.1.1]|uniref:phage tail protein n=3 Tax=Mesorhizobium TaxID=68287 RepID=UPI001093600D|nr:MULTISPECIES: phage tail tape measure protein [unclassified Mesorhizobium]TGQ95421.1 phage tail tape measure protein [Mesorhizobium sp. M8A.F.Ca.ET.208.01.1.1]TGT55912.1 phage tail tape measure protein [Mesorhizobium sp. M8A.F.Ca.ET.167.01.1.1]